MLNLERIYSYWVDFYFHFLIRRFICFCVNYVLHEESRGRNLFANGKGMISLLPVVTTKAFIDSLALVNSKRSFYLSSSSSWCTEGMLFRRKRRRAVPFTVAWTVLIFGSAVHRQIAPRTGLPERPSDGKTNRNTDL